MSSSLLSTLYNLYLAYLLPTIYLGKDALYLNQSYTLLGSSRQQAEGFALEQFYNPLFFT